MSRYRLRDRRTCRSALRVRSCARQASEWRAAGRGIEGRPAASEAVRPIPRAGSRGTATMPAVRRTADLDREVGCAGRPAAAGAARAPVALGLESICILMYMCV